MKRLKPGKRDYSPSVVNATGELLETGMSATQVSKSWPIFLEAIFSDGENAGGRGTTGAEHGKHSPDKSPSSLRSTFNVDDDTARLRVDGEFSGECTRLDPYSDDDIPLIPDQISLQTCSIERDGA
ncbi:hypothetical protein CYMTET_6633 [Cymbomonas tetramitiformis]|uniref:Uncharacterized protein n=1 Tax=Cymbomonas tetramitiformis TaxID=36881 RepID=A0AAE0LHU2_9CHLO|nr:hypothetical protein CYMTET_6633 [Cymbomonas tetramitiformis]